jgi:hypothetical protein
MAKNYKEFLLSYENMEWAWRKVQSLYQRADGIIDAPSIAAFELNLERELKAIITDFESGKYELAPLVVLPQPKKRDEGGNPRMRESFDVAVRDQVAWIALVNVIGPDLDALMPEWSYGHRLYKSAWYDEEGGVRRLATGPYRHTTRNLYRKWQHSWPLFRRHISLTARVMVDGSGALSKIEKELEEAERAALTSDDRPDYLRPNYWPKIESDTLYHASIDLSKFYPHVRHQAIRNCLKLHLPIYRDDVWLRKLVDSLLRFRVSGIGIEIAHKIESEPETNEGRYSGLPTGLMVAGFLSNVAMLPLDMEVAKKFVHNREVAHFRFVDDHAFVASSFAALVEWIDWYKARLKALQVGPKISPTKYEPRELQSVIGKKVPNSKRMAVAKLCEIDGRNPTKLQTRTLALVSTLATMDFDTISIHSKQQRIDELVWLLMADMPEAEIRPDTRVAFAASRISALIPRLMLTSDEVLLRLRQQSANAPFTKNDSKEVRLRKADAAREAKELLQAALKDDKEGRADLEEKYFNLIWRTFLDNTDKPRLFFRLLQYCRHTGYNGLGVMFKWLDAQSNGRRGSEASYFRIIAVQALTAQLIEAVKTLDAEDILARERDVVRRHLRNLGEIKVKPSRSTALLKHPIWDVTLRAFGAALRGAAETLRAEGKRKWSALPIEYDGMAKQLQVPSLKEGTAEWVRKTRAPIGLWVHLIDGGSEISCEGPSPIWLAAAPHHNPVSVLDWNNLRKYPSHLPHNAKRYLQAHGERLKRSDAGWLWDYFSGKQVPSWLSSKQGRPFELIKSYMSEARNKRGMISIEDWIRATRSFDSSDPRGSEWTALELLRMIVTTTKKFGVSLSRLDNLHPANVFVPKSWLSKSGASTRAGWTWEAWKSEVAKSEDLISFSETPLVDYRLSHEGTESMADWDRQFRSCGLLLFSLLRKEFSLPAFWNVRGNQRDVAGFLKRELEEMVISSKTLDIVESALMPRSAETRIIVRFPQMFLGLEIPSGDRELKGTSTEPPVIRGPEELLPFIESAQLELSQLQISVLDHAPRQLVPMHVIQLTRTSVEVEVAADGGVT